MALASATGRSSAHSTKSVKAKDTPTNQGSQGKTTTSRKTSTSASAGREKCTDSKPTKTTGSKSLGRGTATRPTTLTPGGLGRAKRAPVTSKGD